MIDLERRHSGLGFFFNTSGASFSVCAMIYKHCVYVAKRFYVRLAALFITVPLAHTGYSRRNVSIIEVDLVHTTRFFGTPRLL